MASNKIGNLSIQLGLQLAGFESDFKNATRVAQRESRRMQKVIESELRSIKKVVGIASAAFVASAAKFANFEQQMAKVGAVSGATEIELKKLTKAALDFAGSTRFNTSQTTSALNSLSSAGQAVNEQLSTLPNVLNLAEAAGADLGQTTELLVSTMAQFGIEASDSQRVADVFTASITNSSTNVDRLQVAMRNAGAIAPAFNQEFEQTVAVVSILTTAFGNGEKAGTGFASVLDQLAKNGNKLGVDVLDSTGKMKPFTEILKDIERNGITSAEAIKVLGKEAGASLAALINQGSESLDKMESSIKSNGQAASIAAKQIDTLRGDYDQLISALDVAIIKIGQVGSENSNAREAIQSLTDFIKILADNVDLLVDAITLLIKSFVALKIARAVQASIRLLGLEFLIAGKAMEATAVRAKSMRVALGFLGGPAGVAILAAFAVKELSDRYNIFNKNTSETIGIIDNVNKALSKPIDITNIAQVENKYRDVRNELEKLNAELEKAKLADIGIEKQLVGGRRFGGTATQESQVQSEIDNLKIQIKISETLDTAIANLTGTYTKWSKVLKDNVGKAMDSINKKSVVTRKETEEERKTREKALKEARKLYEDLGDSFGNVVSDLQTPLEALDAEFVKQIKTIVDWRDANVENAEVLEMINDLVTRSAEAYAKNKKSIDDDAAAKRNQLTPYEEIIKSLKEELKLLGLKGQDLNRAIAIQELARVGIVKTTTNQEEYNKKLDDYLELLGKINAQNGVFGSGINSFSDLLGSAIESGSFFESMSKGFKSMTKDAESFANGLQSIGDFANFAIDSFQSHAGQDSVGQALNTINDIAQSGALGPVAQAVSEIAGFINQLTGGGLFGTSFEITGSSQNLNIGQQGGSGSVEIRESRRRSLFRGTQRRTTVEDLSSEAQQSIDSLFDTIQNVVATASIAVGGSLEDIITGSFRQVFDEDGNLTREFSTVFGRMFDETFGEFSQRVIAENIISVLDSVLPQVEATFTERGIIEGAGDSFEVGDVEVTRVVGEATALAQQFRDQGADALLEFANFALQAVADIQAGNELLGSLTDTTAFIQDLAIANETLSETYARVQGATTIFQSALDVMGVTLDVTRAEFIRFGVDIAEAAGGLDQAAALWSSYFDTFFTIQELFDQQFAAAIETRNNLLSDIGVSGDVSAERFRQLFEDALPTLSAEAVVQWLMAADALGVVLDLEAQVTEQRQELTDILQRITESNAVEGLSDFELELRRIEQQLQKDIEVANRLGASEIELEMIRRFALRQQLNAIRQLEQSIQSLSTDIFGTANDALIAGIEGQLSGIEQQISLLEQQQAAAAAASQAAIQALQVQQQALQNLADFAESLLTGAFSPLSPQEQLEIAQQQFNAAIAAAQGGDVNAINSLPGLAQILLNLSQINFASGQNNTDIFNATLAALNSLGLGGTFTAPSGIPPAVSSELQGLRELQAQLLLDLQILEQESAAADRLFQERQLLIMITELARATGEAVEEAATRLGIPIEQLIEDLGIDIDALNASITEPEPQPIIIEPPDDPTTNTDIVSTITDEGSQTQEILTDINESFGDLAAEIRVLLAAIAA